MEVSEPACLGLQAGWQCRSPHRPRVIQQALKGASRSSQTAGLFFVQLCSCSWKSCSSSQDSNPHQGLLCRALAGWSTPLADAVWDLRVWRVLKEVDQAVSLSQLPSGHPQIQDYAGESAAP